MMTNSLPSVKSTQGNKAFTLIEILISLTILVIGLVGILALFPTSIASNRSSQDNTQAALLAKSVRNAILDGIKRAERVVKSGQDFYQIPFSHEGIAYEAPVSHVYVNPPASTNIDNGNVGGFYYMGLPVNPVLGAAGTAPKSYFPVLNTLVSPYVPVQELDANAPGVKFRVFYLCRWDGGASGTPQPLFQVPNRITDLETGGSSPENQKDPHAQFSFRIVAEPATEFDPVTAGDKIIPGLWKFQVLVYRTYRGDINNGEQLGNSPFWHDNTVEAEAGGDPNPVIETVTFKALIRS